MTQYSFIDQAALQDEAFLKTLCTSHYRDLYAKIIALDNEEMPLEEIQGQITQGSVTVDGNSIVRRTCSLNLTATNLEVTDYLWGLKTKVHLFVGLKNTINKQYADIIWFKMGVYILTSFSLSVNNDGSYGISLQGKDKMCLLNGDVGGTLTALSYDFANLLVFDEEGDYESEALPLPQIIREAVHVYGNEPYHNIILKDLDTCGLELLEYRGTTPLVYIIKATTKEVVDCYLSGQQTYYYNGQINYAFQLADLLNSTNGLKLADNTIVTFNNFASLIPSATPSHYFTVDTKENAEHFYLVKIEPGMACGYRNTDFVYAGDLTAAVGEPITNVITKIKDMLGEYEYFYNLDGQFVFQKKATSVYTTWNNLKEENGEVYADVLAHWSPYSFSFENNQLLTSFSTSPKIDNIKNDFTVWGTGSSANGNAIPIHMRYAIHKKPLYYTSYDGKTLYTTRANEGEIAKDASRYGVSSAQFAKGISQIFNLDWRELIYQMALDYNKYQNKSNFLITIAQNNPFFYPTGITKYEQYYTDMLEFWRELYNPNQHINYNEITLTKRQFTNQARFHKWYYAAPADPQPCWAEDPDTHEKHLIFDYNENFKYCQKHSDNVFFQVYPTRYEYNTSCSNNIDYYLFTETTIRSIPLQITYPENEVTGEYGPFYTQQAKQAYDIPITQQNFNTVVPSPTNYYYKNTVTEYVPCRTLKPYEYKQYYIRSTEYEPAGSVDELQMDLYYTKSYNYVVAPSQYDALQAYYIAPDSYFPIKVMAEQYIPNTYYIYSNNQFVLSSEAWQENIQYYGYYNRYIYSVVQDLTNEIFQSIKTSLYVKNNNIYQPCTENTVYDTSVQYYSRHENTFRFIALTQTQWNLSVPIVYYIRTDVYTQCEKNTVYNSNIQYYTVKQAFKPVFNLTKTKYDAAEIGKYYERFLVNGQYQFQLPLAEDYAYNPNVRYYYREGNNWIEDHSYYEPNGNNEYIDSKSVEEKQEIYTQQLETYANNYYFKKMTSQLVPVNQPAIPYDTNAIYYEQGESKYVQDSASHYKGWNTTVIEHPEDLVFWIDFLDTQGSLGQYSVDKIGSRSKGVNDNTVTGIYYRDIFPVLLPLNAAEDEAKYGVKTGYTYIQVPERYQKLFSISSCGKSAKSAIDTLLNTHTNYAETISLAAIPIYYLEPNSRIFVSDDKSHISGEYAVTNISFPLDPNGTMSISATKILPPLV